MGSRQSTISRSPTSDIFTPDVESGVQGVHGHSHDSGPKGGGEWERGGFGTGLEERLEAALLREQTTTT
jgi:hypothetical protein